MINKVTSMLDLKLSDFGSACFVPEIESLKTEAFVTELKPSVIPGSPVKLNSQTLTDGVGKGTPAYTAPELFSSNQSYSFPVDMYSAGVVFYTIISQREPFPNCTSTVQLIIAVKRGFFEAENQAFMKNWKHPDPSDGQWQYPSGEIVSQTISKFVFSLVGPSNSRPTAKQLSKLLSEYEDVLLM